MRHPASMIQSGVSPSSRRPHKARTDDRRPRPVPVAFAIPVIVFRLAFAPRRVPVHHRAFLRFAQRPPATDGYTRTPSLASLDLVPA